VTTLTPAGWRARAACRGKDPEQFFGPDGETPAQQAVREAQAIVICAQCPVRATCLQWAMDTNTKQGVWGGTGEAERARTRRQRTRHAAKARRRAAA
jgi:WhiB family redox-sensing transcriptional regulator